MIQVGVRGIGLLGPGLAGWAQGRQALLQPAAWQTAPSVVPAPGRLPATERRRAGVAVRAALVVADEAVAAAGVDPAALATVFTSSSGDPVNCHLLCEALATPERLVSPTRFTNSVHNAAAGYWHIAVGSRAASTSLAAFDASFGAGLLEASVQCRASGAPVLLVASDTPYPEPLHRVRPVGDTFALALVLAPSGGRVLRLLPQGGAAPAGAAATACGDAGLDALRLSNPAARALPFLQALAQPGATTVVIEGLADMALQLQLEATPDA